MSVRFAVRVAPVSGKGSTETRERLAWSTGEATRALGDLALVQLPGSVRSGVASMLWLGCPRIEFEYSEFVVTVAVLNEDQVAAEVLAGPPAMVPDLSLEDRLMLLKEGDRLRGDSTVRGEFAGVVGGVVDYRDSRTPRVCVILRDGGREYGVDSRFMRWFEKVEQC